MHTGHQARHWEQPQLHGVAAVRQAEAGLPWEQEQAHNSIEQEAWLLSFIDILTLLLTLFVLLLAYQKDAGDHEGGAGIRVPMQLAQTVAQLVAPGIAPQAQLDEVRPLPDAPMPGHDPLLPRQVEVLQTVQTPDPAPAAAEPEQQSIVADPPEGHALFQEQAATPMTADDSHYLLWMDTANAQDAADATARIAQVTQALQAAPADDPVQQLLADLRHSTLSGRVEVSVQPDAVNLEISDNILFTPASAALTEGGRDLLDELAATLKNLPYALSVEGHTDNVPIQTAQYPSNWELSAARATMVTRHLVETGIAAERIRAIGYADTRPRADNGSVEGRARNRRVAFVLRMPTQTGGGE